MTRREYTAALVGVAIGWTCALAFVLTALRVGALDMVTPRYPAVLRVNAAAGGVDAGQAAE